MPAVIRVQATHQSVREFKVLRDLGSQVDDGDFVIRRTGLFAGFDGVLQFLGVILAKGGEDDDNVCFSWWIPCAFQSFLPIVRPKRRSRQAIPVIELVARGIADARIARSNRILDLRTRNHHGVTIDYRISP